MPIFEWDDCYRVDIESVDEQHQQLFDMINRLDEGLRTGSDDTLIVDLLEQLFDYTKYHFANEEKMMAQPSFDERIFDLHKAEHAIFIDKMVAAKKAHEEGSSRLSGDLMGVLVSWLIDHIVGTDRRMADEFQKIRNPDRVNQVEPGKQSSPSGSVAPNLIAALRESQDRFKDLTDAVPALIWMTGSDQERQYFDRQWQEFTGFDLAALRAKWRDCLHPDDHVGVEAGLVKAHTERTACDYRYRLRRADGKYRWIHESVVPRYVKGQEFLGLVGCGLDVTNEMKAKVILERANETLEKEVAKRTRQLRNTLDELNGKNTELERANEELRIAQNSLVQSEKMKSIGQLAAGVAHEINTPSQYIADNTRFLQEAYDDISVLIDKMNGLAANSDVPVKSEVIQKALEEVDIEFLRKEIPCAIGASLDGVDQVTRIVKALKDFSRPSNDKEDVILNQAIDSTITVATNEWSSVAEVEVDLDPALPAVFCQRAEFNQVILNALVNSAYAIGQVVGDGLEKKGRITVSTRQVDDVAEICIADTGCGMSPDVMAKAFDPFFTTKGVGDGMGQGLSTAYAIVVDKHGGTIALDSEVGQGTRLTIRLPIEKAASADTPVAA